APAFASLDWNVHGATSTRIERQPADGVSPGSAAPAIESADYTLVASNAAGSASQTIRVYVLRPPVITRFDASAQPVGDLMRIAWHADRASQVFLNDRPLNGAE